MAAQRDKFDQLIASTVIEGRIGRLDDFRTAGAGSPAPGCGFATLVVDGSEPALEVSVTKLPLFGGRDEYLRNNINRWRGQVGVPPMQAAIGWLRR